MRSLLRAALLLLVPALASAQEATPYRAKVVSADIELRTDWYGVYLQTDKIGHLQSIRAKNPDGAVVETQSMQLKLVSFQQKVELNMTQTFVFAKDAPYRLVQGELVQSDGRLKQTTTLDRTADGLRIRHQVPGAEAHVETLAESDYTLADVLGPEAWLRAGPKVGNRAVFRHLDLFERKFDLQTSRITAVKNSLANGVPVRFYEIETIAKNKGIKTNSRHDDKGLLLSDQMGGSFEIRLETEAKAKDTRYSQDLFVMGLAKVDRKVGAPGTVRELVLEMPAKQAEHLADGPRQSLADGDQGKLLKLGRAYGTKATATEAEIKEALTATVAYPLTDAKVRALAEQAVGDATTPREKVKNIVAFVHEFVRPNLSANVPNIYDLMANKKGDCKSYALLTTTLARAAGVPSREVSGLLYVGDDLKAFGGHAWNEVVLDGVWVPVDASMNETEVNATHISFGAEGRATQTLLNTLGQLSFRLVEVKHVP